MKNDDLCYAYKLRIAKLAYKEVQAAMDKFQRDGTLIDVLFHWDECITVDDELFHGFQLRG